jgi:protein-S-isoprenylcysteine O-methyltransferase Ste14
MLPELTVTEVIGSPSFHIAISKEIRMSVENRVESSVVSRLENRFPPPAVVLVLGIVMAGAAMVITPVFSGVIRYSVGPALIALGVAIVVTGARTFWASGTTIDPVSIDRASTLVTHGIFRLTRNPMYVGFTLMLVGWAVVLGSPWMLGGPLLFVGFTHRFQIVPEERVMREKFGREYEAYCDTVRRWI